MNKNKIWFKRRKLGLGWDWTWIPVTWEGWFVIFGWMVFFLFTLTKMDHEWLKNIIVLIFMFGLLIYIINKKSDLRWELGKKKRKLV